MGLISRDVLNGLLLVVHLLGACFCGACLYYIFQAVRDLEREQRESGEAQDTLEVFCPRLCCCFTASQLLFRLTVTTVLFFTVYLIAAVGYRLSFFVFCKANTCVIRLILWEFYCCCVVFCYPLMCVAHFERLRLSFEGTKYSVPLWANKVMYVDIIVMFGGQFAATATYWRFPKISGACFALWVLSYAATVSVLIATFYTKTMAVAKVRAEDDSQWLLLEIVTRLTVIVTVSLLSTAITLFFWVGAIGFCNDCNFLLLLSYSGSTFDFALNCFCLLCSFGSAQKPYQYVFGRMHSAFLRHATLSLRDASYAEAEVERTTSQPSSTGQPLDN